MAYKRAKTDFSTTRLEARRELEDLAESPISNHDSTLDSGSITGLIEEDRRTDILGGVDGMNVT